MNATTQSLPRAGVEDVGGGHHSLILTINGGSSSIKFALFEAADSLRRILGGGIERIGRPETVLRVKGVSEEDAFWRAVPAADHKAAVGSLVDWIEERSGRDLLDREAQDVRPAEAVALFCYQVKKWIGAFAAALGGLDTVVFAGGLESTSLFSVSTSVSIGQREAATAGTRSCAGWQTSSNAMSSLEPRTCGAGTHVKLLTVAPRNELLLQYQGPSNE